jgi:hypothetical protein
VLPYVGNPTKLGRGFNEKAPADLHVGMRHRPGLRPG